jgi:glucokinase
MAHGKKSSGIALIGDIGGTNARFALIDAGGRITRRRTLPTVDYPGLLLAARAYIADATPDTPPGRAAIAVAAPVTEDRITLTNRHWSFSKSALRRGLKLSDLLVVNDFVAAAAAVPALKPADVVRIGKGARVRGAPIAVLGPGTGLGVSLLVPNGKDWLPVPTEGGHITLTATNETEDAIIATLRKRFGHVSAERILSGPGLVNLYSALAEIEGLRVPNIDPRAITDTALAGRDRLATATLDHFCAFLGSVAGDLALTTGARGGVYIAGGIVPRITGILKKSSFRKHFAAKGRFGAYLRAIPVSVITRPQPAFLGLRRLLNR